VLWLNGGPGCSSLDGFLSEHGPFFANEDGQSLSINPYAWNLKTNVIYLESPAGVGFSYSDNPKDYSTGDAQTAEDNYQALQSFFAQFPEFQNRDFYVTGESYGGVYVPTLVQRIQKGNANKEGIFINLKAFAVGNGLVSDRLNDDSLLFFAYYHGLLGQDQWNKLKSYCCVNPGDDHSCNFHNPKPASPCWVQVELAQQVVYNSGLNYYDLYRDCSSNGDPRYQRILNQLFRPFNWNLGTKLATKENLKENVPCIDSQGMTIYLNRADVQAALHVKTGLPPWSICSDVLQYNRTDDDVEPIYPGILKDYRALIYNGDTDMACNFLGDEWAVNDLNRTETAARRTWIDINGQVAGFVEAYDQITFLTVKGAGHMVPQWRPVQALQMFQNFIDNKPY